MTDLSPAERMWADDDITFVAIARLGDESLTSVTTDR